MPKSCCLKNVILQNLYIWTFLLCFFLYILFSVDITTIMACVNWRYILYVVDFEADIHTCYAWIRCNVKYIQINAINILNYRLFHSIFNIHGLRYRKIYILWKSFKGYICFKTFKYVNRVKPSFIVYWPIKQAISYDIKNQNKKNVDAFKQIFRQITFIFFKFFVMRLLNGKYVKICLESKN